MKKTSTKLLFLSTLALAIVCDSYRALKLAFGDVTCSSDVSYLWTKGDGATGSEDKTKKLADESGSKAERVNFISIERRGVDEVAAKAVLLVEVNRQKARAYDRCKRSHESFGDCVATKMSSKGSTLNALSFSTRTRVEQALIVECQGQQGRCGAIESSEPLCREVKNPNTGVLTNEGQAKTKDEATAAGKPLGEVEVPQERESSKEQRQGEEGAAAPTGSKSKAGAAKGKAKSKEG